MTLILYNAAICVYWVKQILLDLCYFTVAENINDGKRFKSATYNFHHFMDTSTSVTKTFGGGAYDIL